MSAFSIVMTIFGIAFAIFGIFCLTKDKKLAGFYKSIGSFGRVYAYLLLACVLGVVLSVVLLIVGSADERYVLVITGIAALAGSVLLPFLLFRRCKGIPKGRLLLDYLIISVGTTLRVYLFFVRIFVKTWYVLCGPTTYVVDGKTVYLYPGSDVAYDSRGYRVGVANSSRTQVVMDS